MKTKYRFLNWIAKASACSGHYGSYSIAIVPVLENEKSGKIVDGKTAYRITGVTQSTHDKMMTLAYYIAIRAKGAFDHEHVDKKMFTVWRKEFAAK